MERFVLFVLTSCLIAIAECKDLPYSHLRRRVRRSEETERTEICIEDLGCYPDPNPDEGWSWSSMSEAFEATLVRSSRVVIGTEFRFWTPGATSGKVITNFDFDTHITESSGYDSKLKTRFIIHGYNGGEAEWALTMKDALISKEPCNVFIVDWSNGDGFLYDTATANTWVVGAEVGHFIERLVSVAGVQLPDVHIIGHSLGAHTAGYAGKWVKNKLGSMVGRVTGLDPAGPDYYSVDTAERLDIGDASFVDVIHTNWALFTFSGLGLFDSVGHFDFYPNGGEDQPGCMTASEAISAGSMEGFACSHSRAIEFFIETIRAEDCSFFAEQCSSWEDYTAGKCPKESPDTLTVQMGYHADEYKQFIDLVTPKKFFLYTKATPPYCLT